jgi:hypothetical protein
VGAGQFQVAAALAGFLAVLTAVDMPAVAMPLHLRFREVGDKMVLEGAGNFEVGRAAVRTLLGMDLMFGEHGAGGWLVPNGARVLAMCLAAAVCRRAGFGRAFGAAALAALVDQLELVFHLREAAAQLGVLRL